MKMNSKNINNLNSCLNFKHDRNKTINKIINSIVKNVDEIEIVDPEKFNDVEFLKLLNLIVYIKKHYEIEIDDEFIVDELNKRFNDNLNNLIKLFVNPEIEIDDELFDDVDDDIIIKNLYIIETLSLYRFIEYYDKFDNKYYNNFYDELIDYLYVYDKFDDDINYDIVEIFQIPENITNYINYDDIIYDLIVDGYYDEIEFNNITYLIHNNYY